MSQGELTFGVDPDFDARGKSPKSKKKKAEATYEPGAWDNCRNGNHRLCAVGPIFENATRKLISCGCSCHRSSGDGAPGSR